MSTTTNMLTGSGASTALDTHSLFSDRVWDRFWTLVDKRGPSECWEWRGSKNDAGYGRFWNGERLVGAHRVVAATIVGRPLLAGHEECACHHCDNPSCVNPAHIFVGTPLDNARDMLRKGRNGVGAKTRLGRIVAAVERQRRRIEWCRGYDALAYIPSVDATIEEAFVACDVQVNDVELEDAPDTDELLDTDTTSTALSKAIASLPFKMRAAMHLRRQGLTLEDIGQRLGVTREYIRQLEEAAIPRIQKHPAIAVLIRGKPFPAPVRVRPVTKNIISTERARDINSKCEAFFARKAKAASTPKPNRARPKGDKNEKPLRRRPTGCSFCQSRDHRINDCLERWRAERRKEAA